MNAKIKPIAIGATLLVTLLALLWAAGSVTAQPPTQGPGGDEAGATVPTWIHVQGRLYFHGNPIADGPHTVRFRLYPAADTAEDSHLWTATQTVTTTNSGLFSTYLDVDQGTFNGQALWLGVKVALDSEMLPRRPLLPVPYALGLAPGALISATSDVVPMLRTINSGAYPALSGYSVGGNGIFGRSDVQDTTKAAVYGYAAEHASGVRGESVLGHGVYGVGADVGVYGTATDGIGVSGVVGAGTGVYAESGYGVGLRAKGVGDAAVYADGSIKSSMPSYIWISGNDLVMGTYTTTGSAPTLSPEYGAAKLVTLHTSGLMQSDTYLPVTIPGVLYGQNVSVKTIRVYYKCSHTTANITRVTLSRMTVGGTWEMMVDDATPHTSTTPTYVELTIPSGGYRTLSSAVGILSAYIQLDFGSTASTIWINGVRLELEHY